MINFKTNIDNNEYITIARYYLTFISATKEYPEDIKNKALEIFSDSLSFERKNKLTYTNEITIHKNSLLATFLLENTNNNVIRNDDLYVYYEDIINAFNIAAFENNQIMHLLLGMLRKRVEGNALELSKKYGNEVIEYISNNKDFKVYLEKLDGTYKPKEYIVYEEGEFSKRTLATKEKQKIK